MEFITGLIKKNWQNKRVQKAVEGVREEKCESSLKKYFIVQKLKIFEELTKFSGGIRRIISMFEDVWRNILNALKIFKQKYLSFYCKKSKSTLL